MVLGAILVVVLRRRKAAVPAAPVYGAEEIQGPYVPELAGTALVRKKSERAELM